jgi:hypothetical protein
MQVPAQQQQQQQTGQGVEMLQATSAVICVRSSKLLLRQQRL